MSILIKSDIDRGDEWDRAFARYKPDLSVVYWPYNGPPEDIDYVLVWKPPPGELKAQGQFPDPISTCGTPARCRSGTRRGRR